MPASASRKILLETVAAALLTAAVCAAFWLIFSQLDMRRGWEKVLQYKDALLTGWWNTLLISAGSLIGSCLVAALLLLGRRAPLATLRYFTKGFIEIVRGMPLLSLLLIGFYVGLSEPRVREFLESVNAGSKTAAGILLLSVFTGTYLSEILRGGLESIPRAQLDSARAVGFDRWQVLRYVVLPQALRRVLPAVAGQFVTLVKDSSLLCVLGVNEFTYEARAFYSATYLGVEAFLPLAVGYLALTLPIAAFSSWLERRFRETAAS